MTAAASGAIGLTIAAIVVFAIAGIVSIWLVKRLDVGDEQ